MYREKHKTNTTMNKFGSKERVPLSGKWALQLDQIEPTMVLHVDDDCDIQLYNLD